jgi:PAS domain S-box-containing protein
MPANNHTLDFEQVVNSLNRGVYCTDLTGHCVFINQSAAEMLGYTQHYCLGKNMHQLIHHHDVSGSPYPEEHCPVCNATDGDKGRNDEVFWRADGSWFYVRHSCTALIDKGIVKGAVMAFSDITEQRQKQVATLESERRYKLLFEDNPLPMFVWDFETLQIVDCNEEAIIKYGYTREEFLKLNLTQVRPVEDIQLIKDAVKNETVYGKVHKRVWRHLKKSGELMYVEVTGHLIDFNGVGPRWYWLTTLPKN